jgi:cytochrome c oxidase cbb3-type subunit 1
MVRRSVADARLGRLSCRLPGTIWKRKEPHIYVANWFYLAFIVTIAMLHIVNNLHAGQPGWLAKLLGVGGVQGAGPVVVRPQRGRLLPHRRLPGDHVLLRSEAGERPVYSYRLSIVHFWSLIFIYIWAGPAPPSLHGAAAMGADAGHGVLDHAVDAQLGRHDQRPDDAVGRLGQAAHGSGLRMLVVSVAFYGMSTFEGPVMSIRGQRAVALYRLDHRPRALRRAGLGRL